MQSLQSVLVTRDEKCWHDKLHAAGTEKKKKIIHHNKTE